MLAHPECHADLHAHPALARERGFIVSLSGDPLVAPLLIGGTWYVLDDAGSRERAETL